MRFNQIATQLIHFPYDNIQQLYLECWKPSDPLSCKNLRQTHNLTPLTEAEVKQAFHDFIGHQLDTQKEALPRIRFGMDWWLFLEVRHKELHGQTLPMQEDGSGVASGSQNPAPASHVVAVHVIVPLTGLRATQSAFPPR